MRASEREREREGKLPLWSSGKPIELTSLRRPRQRWPAPASEPARSLAQSADNDKWQQPLARASRNSAGRVTPAGGRRTSAERTELQQGRRRRRRRRRQRAATLAAASGRLGRNSSARAGPGRAGARALAGANRRTTRPGRAIERHEPRPLIKGAQICWLGRPRNCKQARGRASERGSRDGLKLLCSA